MDILLWVDSCGQTPTRLTTPGSGASLQSVLRRNMGHFETLQAGETSWSAALASGTYTVLCAREVWCTLARRRM